MEHLRSISKFNSITIQIISLIILLRISSVSLQTIPQDTQTFPFNITQYPKKIEITSDDDDLEIISMKCTEVDHKTEIANRLNSQVCEDLNACTNYQVDVEVYDLIENKTIDYSKVINTTYAEPFTAFDMILPFEDYIFLSWNSSNSQCISVYYLKVTSGEYSHEYNMINSKREINVTGLEPCTIYNIQLSTEDIYKSLQNETIIVNTSIADPGAVSSINITTYLNNTAIVSWKPPKYESCIDHYYLKWTILECYYANPGNCYWKQHQTTNNKLYEITIDDLEGCQDYVLFIIVNGDQINSSPPMNFSTEIQAPGSVEIQTDEMTSEVVKISWKPPINNSLCVDYYQIHINGPSMNVYYNVTTTSLLIHSIKSCGTYNVTVTGYGDIEGVPANIQFTKTSEKPSTVQNEIYIPNPKELTIKWDPPVFGELCVSSYRVVAWYLDSSEKPQHVFDQVTNETSIIITNLIACMRYDVEIIAVTFKPEESTQKILLAETSGIVLDAPGEPELRFKTSSSLELISNNNDKANNCPLLYGKFICEPTNNNNEIGNVELIVEIENNRGILTGNVKPLLPFTQYKCYVSIYNTEGWSKNSIFGLFTTRKYYPEIPRNVRTYSTSNTSIVVRWEEPKNANGNLGLYKVYIQTVQPMYTIPSYCSPLKWQNITHAIEGSKLEFIFQEALPYVQYSVQVSAVNDYGPGDFSIPRSVTTLQWISEPVNKFESKIEGPELSTSYKASVVLSWSLPCQANGRIYAFQGYFRGSRPGFDDEFIKWDLILNKNDNKNDSGIFSLRENRLKPEYEYEVIIQVFNEGIFEGSETKTLYFSSPAGIPEAKNVSDYAEMNTFAAKNPTSSSVVKLSKKMLNSSMGTIRYVALLLSEKDCQNDPIPKYDLIDSIQNWPEIPTWSTVHDQSCIKQYQTTPKRWEPFNLNGRESDIKTNTFVEYTIGVEECENVETYCNGPLKSDRKYMLVVRLFTNSGYSDVAFMQFKTDSEVKIYLILLLVVSCLFFAFILGFIYLWVTKKIIWYGDERNNIEDQSGDISGKNFLVHYEELTKQEKILREFKELNAITNDLKLSNLASKSNELKNRYSNIFPYDKNRVILDSDSGGSDYINASFINGYKNKKEYIATQGPKPESSLDFWKMILQYNVHVIVMVTQLKEGEIIKCHQYFPFFKQEMKFDNSITVTCTKESIYDIYDRRELLVEDNLESIKKTIVHFNFKKWPDHDCPNDPTELIEFRRKIKVEKNPSHSPIVIHCSAGVGRTGTLIGLDIIAQRLKTENKINIFETVKQLRFQRMRMVQTVQQYKFLYTCTLQLISKKRSARLLLKYKNQGNSDITREGFNNTNESESAM